MVNNEKQLNSEESNRRQTNGANRNQSHGSNGLTNDSTTRNTPQDNRTGSRAVVPTGSRPQIVENPVIPEEVGNPDCPVCLNRVQNRAYTDKCLHEFCYPCIQEWSRTHNRCPVCREVYRRVLHNIRSTSDYDELAVSEPPDPTHGMVVAFGDMAIVVTPPQHGMYMIEPQITPHGIRHNILFLGPNQAFVLHNYSENIRIVTPDRLEPTLLEMGARPHHPHHGRHPFRSHPRHHRNGSNNGH